MPARDEEAGRGPGARCTPNKHQGLSADNDAAAGARVEEAQEEPWRDSQGFLPLTLRDEQPTRPLSATLLAADWWALGWRPRLQFVPQALSAELNIPIPHTLPHTSLTPSAHPGPQPEGRFVMDCEY